MGVDVVIKARTNPRLDEESFEDIRERFRTEFPDDGLVISRRYPDLRWDAYEDEPTIKIDTLHRYYGQGYERGHWPDIRKLGDWLVEVLPAGAEVRYGGDSYSEWDGLSPWLEVVKENDEWWASVGNEPYRAYFRRRTEGHPT